MNTYRFLLRHAARLLPFFALLFASGCETTKPYLRHPDFASRSASLETPVALPPNITINKVTAGGILEKDEEKTGDVAKRIKVALEGESLDPNGPSIRFVNPPATLKDSLEDMLALSEAVSRTIIFHLYNPEQKNFYKHKIADFRYSVGKCGHILDELGGDSLIIINGYEQYASAARATLNLLGTIAMAAATNSSVVYSDASTYASTMVVDRNGDVIFFSYRDPLTGQLNSLRADTAAEKTVKAFVSDYRDFQ